MTGQASVTLYLGAVEIRKYGQGAAEEILLYPHPNIRITTTKAGSTVTTQVNALHLDGLGSVRAVTDGAGAAVERTGYRPYGEEVAVQQPLTLPEAKGFIGERLDGDAGLQYLNARYYDPRLGMFVQPDWWEVTQAGVGTNRYSYSGGDPVNRLDPSGHSWLGDAVRDIGRSIRDSFGALGDALSGNVTRHNNAGQPGTNGAYGVARGLDGTTHGCFGCSGTGSRGQQSIDRAIEYVDRQRYGPEVTQEETLGVIGGFGAIACPECAVGVIVVGGAYYTYDYFFGSASIVAESSAYPPGYMPADKGAIEWGRLNDIPRAEAKAKFHRLKGKNNGSSGAENMGVDPDSGDVVDSNGESIGNLNDE